MVGKLILRGLIIGVFAGLLAFGYARIFGEPSVATAVQLEDMHADQAREAAVKAGKAPEPEEAEMFSRDIQSGVGLLTGLVGLGAGIGAVFGVLFAFAYGRIADLGVKATAGVVGLISFVTVYVAPALKYPANPPTVGAPETIKMRTGLYFLMMGLSIASTLLGLFVRRRLLTRLGAWNASLTAALVYGIALTAVFTVLPTINEVPPDFPAVAMWNFRVASFGIQAILWGVTAIAFGYLSGLSEPKR